jgi:hydrogenase/urease accessory protein HupE
LKKGFPAFLRDIHSGGGSLLRRSLVLVAMAMPIDAHAHAMFGSAAPFWSGVLHVLVTPLALAGISALVLALAEASEGAIMRALAGAAIAACGGAELTSRAAMPDYAVDAIAAVCIAAISIVVLFSRRPSHWLAAVTGAGGGIAAGVAVGVDVPDWGGSFGVGIALLVLASWGVAGLARLQQRFADRVLQMRRVAAVAIALLAVVSAFTYG